MPKHRLDPPSRLPRGKPFGHFLLLTGMRLAIQAWFASLPLEAWGAKLAEWPLWDWIEKISNLF